MNNFGPHFDALLEYFRPAYRLKRLHCRALLLSLIAPLAVMPAASAFGAEVEFEDASQQIIVFRGPIDRDAVSQLKILLSRWQSARTASAKRPSVKIESPGGDVDAALEAGRLLRAAQATVLVFGSPAEPVCSSSCVFLVAGGVERYVIGGLAIHNFFVASGTLTYREVTSTRRRLEESIRIFLAEMNVSARLYDQMVAVPPQKLRLLSEQERDEFGLGMNDPAFHDFRLGEQASRRGIDKATYIARLGSLLSLCGQPPSPPPFPSAESLTRAELAAYRERDRRYSIQKDRLDKVWNECKEDVLAGRWQK